MLVRGGRGGVTMLVHVCVGNLASCWYMYVWAHICCMYVWATLPHVGACMCGLMYWCMYVWATLPHVAPNSAAILVVIMSSRHVCVNGRRGPAEAGRLPLLGEEGPS